MNDAQRLEKLIKAEGLLKRTKAGYTESPEGPYWRTGMPLLWEVRKSLGSSANGQALAEAHGVLKLTERGYDQTAPRWKKAMGLIDRVEANLEPVLVPALGPVKRGGKSVLLHQLTHNTDGFDGIWPAFDDTNVRVGTSVIAPESCRVVDHTGSDGGVGFKVRGASGIVHLFLHQASRPPMDAVFLKGEQLSSVARITAAQGGPHIHYALDTRPLVGRWLKYGRNGNGPDYTFGSPTVGVQLAQLLGGMTYDNTGLKREVLEGEPLTERELVVLDLGARGLTASETGQRLHLSVETIRSYRKQAMYKLYARNTTHAIVLAVGLGYVNVIDLIDEWEAAHGPLSRDGLSKVFGSTEYMTWASRLGNLIDARKVASEFAGQRKPKAGSKYAQGLIDICRDNPPAGPDPPDPEPPAAIPAPFSGKGMVLLEPTGGSEDMNVTKAAGFTYVLLNLAFARGGDWSTVRQRAAAAGVEVVPWRRVYSTADCRQIEDTATAWGCRAVAHNLEGEAMTTLKPVDLAAYVKQFPARVRAVITEPWAQNGAGWHHLANWVGMPEAFLNASDRYLPADLCNHLIAEGMPRCVPMHGWGSWSDAPILVPPSRYLEVWPRPRPFAVYFGDSREPQYPEWR